MSRPVGSGAGMVVEHPEYLEYITVSGLSYKVDFQDEELLRKYSWHSQRRRGEYAYLARQTRRVNGRQRTVYFHKEILSISANSKYQVDHKDGDIQDNRRSNLRKCTPSQNRQNSKVPTTSTCGYKGVHLSYGGQYRARIGIPNTTKKVNLGMFKTAEEAAQAYDNAAGQMYGEFARMNFRGNK